MKKRTITAIIMLAVFVPLLIIPTKPVFILFQILMLLLMLVAVHEMIEMFGKQKRLSMPVKILLYLTSTVVYLTTLSQFQPPQAHVNDYARLLTLKVNFISIFIAVLVVLFICFVFDENFGGADIGKALTIICYCGIGFAGITALRYIGIRLIIYLFMLTILTDTFAYFCGMLFGKHKMAPKISPKKTWEGAVGGTVFASIISTLYAFFYGDIYKMIFGKPSMQTIFDGIIISDHSRIQMFFILLAISIIGTVMAQIGDLVASKLKRTYEIKDFGKIFPGHGGVLDRLDSAIFAALFLVFLVTFFMGIVSVG